VKHKKRSKHSAPSGAAPLKQLFLFTDGVPYHSVPSQPSTDRRYVVESKCLICDSWQSTPHAKRFTTPIPPHYAEEALITGYWLGSRQGVTAALCEKHKAAILALDRRAAPTTPPPPPPSPSMNPPAPMQTPKHVETSDWLVTAMSPPKAEPAQPWTTQKNWQARIEQAINETAAAATTGNNPIEALRKSFLTIAQSCATEYVRQQILSNPTVLQQALQHIAETSNDPDAAQFAARVIDGTASPPSAASETSPTETKEFPCPLCNKLIKPGEVHAC
jgi:hypothetical protein